MRLHGRVYVSVGQNEQVRRNLFPKLLDSPSPWVGLTLYLTTKTTAIHCMLFGRTVREKASYNFRFENVVSF